MTARNPRRTKMRQMQQEATSREAFLAVTNVFRQILVF